MFDPVCHGKLTIWRICLELFRTIETQQQVEVIFVIPVEDFQGFGITCFRVETHQPLYAYTHNFIGIYLAKGHCHSCSPG